MDQLDCSGILHDRMTHICHKETVSGIPRAPSNEGVQEVWDVWASQSKTSFDCSGEHSNRTNLSNSGWHPLGLPNKSIPASREWQNQSR